MGLLKLYKIINENNLSIDQFNHFNDCFIQDEST